MAATVIRSDQSSAARPSDVRAPAPGRRSRATSASRLILHGPSRTGRGQAGPRPRTPVVTRCAHERHRPDRPANPPAATRGRRRRSPARRPGSVRWTDPTCDARSGVGYDARSAAAASRAAIATPAARASVSNATWTAVAWASCSTACAATLTSSAIESSAMATICATCEAAAATAFATGSSGAQRVPCGLVRRSLNRHGNVGRHLQGIRLRAVVVGADKLPRPPARLPAGPAERQRRLGCEHGLRSARRHGPRSGQRPWPTRAPLSRSALHRRHAVLPDSRQPPC